MILSFIPFLMALLFPFLILITVLVMSFHSLKDREKSSPYECGFDPNISARLPFSTRFFLLAVLFLVFDIEIVLLLPVPIISMFMYKNLIIILFLLILFLGLIHEWHQGSLDWSF
uniref:NADH dehydrogenase subunit 3 n=1 Tax=Manayunkia occidentalis TaxID=2704156 RepID=UPI00165F2EE0|nr:NADH dehydrogenase subunit 3 [Manayunkia occidentalis]QLM00890.1 NADH dehydrogenase subunit 3 [Manayunkia occidentalis]